MPVHQISVMPVSGEFNVHCSIRPRKKSKEKSSTHDLVTFGNGPGNTTAVAVNHSSITKQQVKRRYRRQRRSSGCMAKCVEPKSTHKHDDTSSGDEQYHRAARSWSHEKARRRRRSRVITCSHEAEAQTQDQKPARMTSLKMEELCSKSDNQARECVCGTTKGSGEKEPITKRHEEQGSGDMALPTAPKYIETSDPNGTLLESCAEDKPEVCRICHCDSDEECPLIAPCRCTGSLRFVHHSCLHQWIQSSGTRCCELCKYDFIMEMHLKPLHKWENLQLTTSECRRIFCSVIFHLAAVMCLAWSLYTFVLINSTAEGLQQGNEHNEPLEWLLWTKLGIVALSVVAGFIFMCIQCKVYLNLWRRLKAFNCVIFVHNCPDSVCKGADKVFPRHQTQADGPCIVPAEGNAEEAPV